MISHRWYSVVNLGKGIHLISEPAHVNLYLICGADRALLVDTGLGLFDLHEVVREITELPVVVVNTHSHLDHRGGNRLFDDVRVHSAGADELGRGADADELAWFPGYARRVSAAFAAMSEFEDDLFHLVDAAMIPRPVPSAKELAAWRIPGQPPTAVVDDGQLLDLGGRIVEVIHAPGHSPDSIVLLDTATGTLFGGDVLVAGVSYAHLSGAEPHRFAASVSELHDRTRSRLTRILVAHTMRFDQTPDFLDEVVAGWRTAVAGEARWRRWHDMFGNGCFRTDFRRFSITLAAEPEAK